MTILKYTGTSHFREISKADFSRLEFDQGAIKVARHDIFPEDNWKALKTTVEVDDEAAEWLLENEPGDWAVVEDDEVDEETPAQKRRATKKATEKRQQQVDSASDAPSGSPDSPSVTTGGTSTASSTT